MSSIVKMTATKEDFIVPSTIPQFIYKMYSQGLSNFGTMFIAGCFKLSWLRCNNMSSYAKVP